MTVLLSKKSNKIHYCRDKLLISLFFSLVPGESNIFKFLRHCHVYFTVRQFVKYYNEKKLWHEYHMEFLRSTIIILDYYLIPLHTELFYWNQNIF